MKNKIRFGIAVLTVATIAAFNVFLNTNSNNLSDVSLANVEALAIREDNPHDFGNPATKYCITKGSGYQGQPGLVNLLYCADCKPILTEPKTLNSTCFSPV